MRNYWDEDDTERQMHAGMVVLAVFTKDGRGQTFSYVDEGSIQFKDGMLTFNETHYRKVHFPNVDYWTTQDVA